MVSSSDILNAKVLIVDDLEANVRLLERMLKSAGYASIASTMDPLEVCELHRNNRYDLILLDLMMPGMDGFQVMEDLKEIEPDGYFPVLVITAQPAHKLRALEAGAKDFISKPFNLLELQTRIHNLLEVRLLYKKIEDYNTVLEQRVEERTLELRTALSEIKTMKDQLETENIYFRHENKMKHQFEHIIGQSDGLKYVLYRAEQVAPANTTVLILGETGTGKELVAAAIHNMSPRKERPLITVNCAALPGNLIESELFGREKGAFTGADTRQVGRFEVANGSTLCLDEIGELPLELQAKLLRVIQHNEFERLGSSHTIKVDVRIVATTNRDLEEEVRKGRFRQDLYYRINVFPITVPPLRQRKDDIPLMVQAFIERYSRKLGKHITSIQKETLKALQD
ncbi:MAG: sigma-54 dependent transcriptional regulator, partial [Deltaproteobacteria bacterium]|nr:sigma-54 dependent transcriptional regulator [Deltaproteobacteria bacterium]